MNGERSGHPYCTSSPYIGYLILTILIVTPAPRFIITVIGVCNHSILSSSLIYKLIAHVQKCLVDYKLIARSKLKVLKNQKKNVVFPFMISVWAVYNFTRRYIRTTYLILKITIFIFIIIMFLFFICFYMFLYKCWGLPSWKVI